MGKVMGIDLGTTNSCVVVMEGGTPVVVPNSEGSRVTPSMVAFTKEGERLIGHSAKRQAIMNAQNTVFAVKRLMGRKFNTPEVQKILKHYPYEIVSGTNGDAAIRIENKNFSPVEISSMIINQMRFYAEDYLGEKINDAVITVPAYFDDTQRQATRDAGRIAGLNVLRIINEPTASALAFGLGKKTRGRIAVYDFGGGTLDISILEVGEGVFQVKTTHGDTFLGGEDMDMRIIDYIADSFFKEHGINLKEDIVALQRLKDAAEKAKIELSSQKEVEINLPFIYADDKGPKHLYMTLKRQKLEELVEDLVDKSIEYCDMALKDGKLTKEDIDEVILVGGITKMPIVQQKVAAFFNIQPNKSVNPDEAVAIGAGIQAGILKGEIEEVLLLDVIPLSLGIETQGGIFTKLIEKNTTIPTSITEVFTTAEDYQPLVNIHVLQGERPMARDNKSLARFELLGIPPARRGIPKIEVTFEIDVNGILQVTAKDLGTGNMQTVRVRPTSGLTEKDIERLIKEAAEYEKIDEEKKEIVVIKNKADGLIYTTERSLAEFINYLTEEEIATIEKDLERCKKAKESNDKAVLLNAIKSLERSSYRIAELMYKEVKA